MAGLTGPGPSLRAQWLGDRLRNLRKARSMSLRYVGEYLQRDAGTLSRYENGELVVRRGDLLALMDLYGVSDEKERRDLEQLREEAWRKGWWDRDRDILSEDFFNVPWLESRANRRCSYHNMLVDGLLQTRAYAEALIRYADRGVSPEEQIQRWIDFRMERQRILDRDEPKHLEVILEETVLHRPIGGLEVLREQLEFLLDRSRQDHIQIRVMPLAAAPHAGHEGSFTVFDMPEPYPQVAHVDTAAGQLFVEDPAVHLFTGAWEALIEDALSPELSCQVIRKRLEELK